MQSETIRSHWPAHSLGVMSCLAALVMASEAGAGALFLGQKFPVGIGPRSVAVADLDGDSVPDLVTANQSSNDVTVLLPEPDVRLLLLAGVGLLALLARRRSTRRAR
jgi:hypothetical protein